MERYTVTGMSCAACVARVEKAVNSVEGIESVSVNLLTNSMNVEGNASFENIKKAVEDAGYGIEKANKEKNTKGVEEVEDTTKKEINAMLKRLISSSIFVLILMYFSMGHMMWNFPVPTFLVHNHIGIGIIELILSAIIMVINQKFFISGFKGLMHKSPNMDTLVAMGSGVSFLWSVVILMQMTLPNADGMKLMDSLYFESAAMILVLITVGKTLETYSKGKTTNALKALKDLAPKTALILESGKEKEIPVEDINKGDIFILKPGMIIPADGIVLEGEGAVDESALTGESVPVDKYAGSKVSAATINKSGYLKCEAKNVGEDTGLSKIIQMVSDSAGSKAPIAKIADKVSAVFVPSVLVLSLITFLIWIFVKGDIAYSIARAVSVLVISCPCALGLATPVAIMVGNGVGAKNGILFKTAEVLENAGKTQIVAFDKTGTITEGEPIVTDHFTFIDDYDFLDLTLSIESQSEHPLGKAIVGFCEINGAEKRQVKSFEALAGCGVKGIIDNKEIYGGSLNFISNLVTINEDIKRMCVRLSSEGKTPLLFTYDNKFIGYMAVADIIREESKVAIDNLKGLGIRVVMITGDNKATATEIADEAGIEEVYSDVLPEQKKNIIAWLSKQGKTAMVGDGINDAVALTEADTGIAIGAGTDVAMDAADIVLENSNLADAVAAIRLSRAVIRNIKQNLFWAFCYNLIGIPLAAGAFINLFGWELNPMFGAAAMSISSFLVVSNALRLNLFKLYSDRHDKMIKQNKINKEAFVMEKVVKINGMMCPHCEATMKKAFEALDEVDSAVTSHTENNAVLTLNSELSDEKIKATVEAAGYEYIG